MNTIKKAYWKTRNYIEATKTQIKKDPDVFLGSLKHKEDKRDFKYGSFWPFPAKAISRNSNWNIANDFFRFNQAPFNMCVFASGVLGASHQEGKRFSVRFAVQLARRDGMITKDGFSYLRACREISVKYGRLPYEFMPDETTGMSWDQYSKYSITPAMLKEAAKWKAPNYQIITGMRDIVDAMEKGYVIYTSNAWFRAMNAPTGPDYYLRKEGGQIGYHAWGVYGYRVQEGILKDAECLQTFSKHYGFEEGKARIQNLVNNAEAFYIEEKIAGRTDEQRFLDVYTGQCVKSPESPVIYLIKDGKKLPFKNMVTFNKVSATFHTVPQPQLDTVPTGDLI